MRAGWDASRGAGFTSIEPAIGPRECRGWHLLQATCLLSINSQGAYAFRMMRMTVLASGSKGNSTLVSSSRTRILVDAGLSCRELLKRMQMADEDPAAIDALLITHEHQDHVQGVAVLARKLGVPVYFTQATHRAWMRWMMPHKRMTYAAWLAQRQQDLAQQQAAAVPADEDAPCAEECCQTIVLPETKAGRSVPAARGGVLRRRQRILDWRHRHHPVHHSPRCGRPGRFCF